MATLFVDKVDPQSGTSLEIGSSGDTITIPSGATITNNGTQTECGVTNTPNFSANKKSESISFSLSNFFLYKSGKDNKIIPVIDPFIVKQTDNRITNKDVLELLRWLK